MTRLHSMVSGSGARTRATASLDGEHLLVERLADDDRRRRRSGASASRSSRRETPPEAITGHGEQPAREPRRRVEVRAAAHAVARDVGVEHGRRARARDRQRRASTASAPVVSVQPSTATLPSRASTATTMRPRPARARRLDQRGILDRRGAEHDEAARPASNSARAVVERAHAAADLDRRRPPPRRCARSSRGCPCARPRRAERGVEIDDVEARGAGGGEPRRHLPGRAVVDRGALAPPLLQAHGGAVQQIDRGEDQHRGGRLTSAIRRRRSCAAARGPRPGSSRGGTGRRRRCRGATAAQKATPCSLVSATSSARAGSGK